MLSWLFNSNAVFASSQPQDPLSPLPVPGPLAVPPESRIMNASLTDNSFKSIEQDESETRMDSNVDSDDITPLPKASPAPESVSESLLSFLSLSG